MPAQSSRPGSGKLAGQVIACFAAAYLLSYAFRSINAVIAPALRHDLHLTNADLGWLSSAYFISFAAMQLPLGVWLDRYGPRRTEAALLLIAAGGAALFASGTSLTALWLGRALVGVGVSGCLMAAFKAYRQWFAPAMQSRLASWMLVAGTGGALLATMPVALALPAIGWRGIFWIMAVLILLAAAAIFWLVKPFEAQHAATAATAPDAGHSGYRAVFGNARFRRLGLLGLVNQGSFSALQTLWAGPWMGTVLGMDTRQTSQILFAFNLCLMLAYLGLGWLAPRHIAHAGGPGRPAEQVVVVGLLGALAMQTAIATITAPWAWLFWIGWAVFATVMMLVQAEVNLSFPSSAAGRANSAYNLLVFSGAFIVQWGVGVLIDIFGAHGAAGRPAMRMAFAACIAAQALSLLIFVLGRTRAAPRDYR